MENLNNAERYFKLGAFGADSTVFDDIVVLEKNLPTWVHVVGEDSWYIKSLWHIEVLRMIAKKASTILRICDAVEKVIEKGAT